MKVFTREHRITGEYHPLFKTYFKDLKPCVMDIEATGLDSLRCKVILIGLLVRTESGVQITQFLAENHYEEAKVLDAAMDFIEELGDSYLITYNGYGYDVPFVNKRLEYNMMGRELCMYHFDLYRFLKKYSGLRTKLPSLSQTAVEEYYGILSDRGDTITGRESISLFNQYAVSGNSTIEKIILTHNREDVLHLNRLMYLALAEVHNMHEALAGYGFPAAAGRLSVRPAIDRQKSLLKIRGEQIKNPIACAYFPDGENPLEVSFRETSASYEIDAPLGRHNDEFFMDISFSDALSALNQDEDCVNGYLILNSRTINLLSSILVESYL